MIAGFVVNPSRQAAVQCAADMARWLRERGVRVRLQAGATAADGMAPLRACGAEDGETGSLAAVADEELGAADFLVAFGGDGTLLSASRLAAPHDTPILGIHAGGPASFGFLTETTPANAARALEQVLAGQYRIDERMMVSATVVRDGQPAGTFSALNDLVIGKSALARMLKMRIFVGETFIANYAAAGGPLVHPTVRVIILTPICPHTLNVRSLIIGEEEQARVVTATDARDSALLTVDGQVGFELSPGDVVEFERAACRARFILLDGADFYQKLQTRLRLGERFGTGS
jgi:NAD+ kinase